MTTIEMAAAGAGLVTAGLVWWAFWRGRGRERRIEAGRLGPNELYNLRRDYTTTPKDVA